MVSKIMRYFTTLWEAHDLAPVPPPPYYGSEGVTSCMWSRALTWPRARSTTWMKSRSQVPEGGEEVGTWPGEWGGSPLAAPPVGARNKIKTVQTDDVWRVKALSTSLGACTKGVRAQRSGGGITCTQAPVLIVGRWVEGFGPVIRIFWGVG